jgi:hypothetical protein
MSDGNDASGQDGPEGGTSKSKDDSRTGIVIGLVMFGAILVLMIAAQLLRT